MMYDPTMSKCPLTNDLGTDRDLAFQDAATGVTSVVNHWGFGAFGNLKSQGSVTVHCPFGFMERLVNETTELQSNLNRWYDAKVGRWLEEDPLGLEAEDVNTDVYCGNSPTNTTDPSGLQMIQEMLDWQDRNRAQTLPPFSLPASPAKTAVPFPVKELETYLLQLVDASTLSGTEKAAAQYEAQEIAKAIARTWNENPNRALPPDVVASIQAGGEDERVRGYWCYEWAMAFQIAFDKAPHSHFEAAIEFATEWGGKNHPSDPNKCGVHFWVAITLNGKDTPFICVHDGFGSVNKMVVWNTRPIPTEPARWHFRNEDWRNYLDWKNEYGRFPDPPYAYPPTGK